MTFRASDVQPPLILNAAARLALDNLDQRFPSNIVEVEGVVELERIAQLGRNPGQP